MNTEQINTELLAAAISAKDKFSELTMHHGFKFCGFGSVLNEIEALEKAIAKATLHQQTRQP
jgi:hypothetical protein